MTGVGLLMQIISKMRSVGVEPSRIVAGPKAYEALRYGCLIPPGVAEFRFLGLPVEIREDCSPQSVYVLSQNTSIEPL